MRHANSAQVHSGNPWAIIPVGIYCAAVFVFSFVARALEPLAPYQFEIGAAVFVGLTIWAGVFIARNFWLFARCLGVGVAIFSIMLAMVGAQS